jgi:hypothetical protein
MIEILVIWFLASKIGKIAKQKGHKSGGYIALTVVLWIVGELVGAVVGALALVIAGAESSQCLIYLFALAGAGCGAGIAYLIANNLSQRAPLPAPVGPTGTGPDEPPITGLL